MKTKTLQEQYNLIKEGKGNKETFLKEAKLQFPHLVRNAADFNETTTILKQRSVISENILQLGLVTQNKKQDWFDIFNQNIINEAEKSAKAEEKKVSKEVEDNLESNFDYKDKKNTDNVYGGQFLNGFYTEMQNPKNADKTVEELKAIVTKNLTKDRLYYTTQTQFGIEGIGYTDQTPGYKPSKELKGKYKSSGYGDLDIDTEKIKANTKDTLGNKEAKTKMPSGVKEMPVTPKTVKGVKKMDMPGVEKKIKLQEGINSYNNMSDQEIIDWAKDDGFDEGFIELDDKGNLVNRNELLKYILGKEVDNSGEVEDFDYDTRDKEIDWDENDLDPAGGRGLSSHLEESKVRKSLKEKVKKIIEKILNERNTLDEGEAEDKAAADAAKKNSDAQKTAAAAAATAADAAKKAADAKKKEAETNAATPGLSGAGQ